MAGSTPTPDDGLPGRLCGGCSDADDSPLFGHLVAIASDWSQGSEGAFTPRVTGRNLEIAGGGGRGGIDCPGTVSCERAKCGRCVENRVGDDHKRRVLRLCHHRERCSLCRCSEGHRTAGRLRMVCPRRRATEGVQRDERQKAKHDDRDHDPNQRLAALPECWGAQAADGADVTGWVLTHGSPLAPWPGGPGMFGHLRPPARCPCRP